jgi:hypothetical protein
MEGPTEGNPWKTLDVKEIVNGVKSTHKWLIKTEDKFTDIACFDRIGHFCRKGICGINGSSGLWARRHFEDAGRCAERALKDLSTKDPKVYGAIKDLERIKQSIEEGLEEENEEMLSTGEGRKYDAKLLRWIVNGSLSSQDIKGFFPLYVLPQEGPEWPWLTRTEEYLNKYYSTRKYLYDLHLLMIATQADNEVTFPTELLRSWGYEKLQRKVSAIFIKEHMAARRSELLLRAGWAPPFLVDEIHRWVDHDKQLKFEGSYYKHTPQGNQPLHHEIAAQAIDYLCCHLF